MPRPESYPPAYPHDSIEEVITDVFMVRGTIRMNAMMRITRNMAVLRHDGELTLVNPIRLDEAGLTQLSTIGDIKRILRIGSMHGIDDPFYIDRYGAELWAEENSITYPVPKIDRQISANSILPFPDARLFCFEGMVRAESALLIEREGGLLLTCDALQHYGDYRHTSFIARALMPFIGFPKKMVVGPIWLKMMTPEGSSLESEFRRLLELDFDHFLSAHGSLLRDTAHAAVAEAVDRAFPG